MTSGSVLSDEQVAQFRRDGFLVVRGMFSEQEMAEIAAWTDEVEGWPEVPGKYMMYFEKSLRDPQQRILNRLENFYPFHAGFRTLFDGEKLRGGVSRLFGEDAVLYKEKINFKMPGGDGFKLHQDQQAGWSVYADLFITALLSIDEATEENGCLQLVAGMHKRGLLGKEWEPMTEADLDGAPLVPCPTQPGDVVFFDSYCPHGSGPNLSDRKRRVLYVTYNKASDGDHRERYYADKRKSFPPDIEREPNKEYVFKV